MMLRCLRLSALRGAACAAALARGAARNASSTAAAPAAAATPAAATPAYTVKELPETAHGGGVPRATASVKFVRGHTKKLSPLARQVKGLSVPEALVQMAISPASRSEDVAKVIRRAAKQAEIYHGLAEDRLMVEAAWTGKHQSSPRVRHHGKGRTGRSHKRTSQVALRVREMSDPEREKLVRFKGRPTPESIALLDPRAY